MPDNDRITQILQQNAASNAPPPLPATDYSQMYNPALMQSMQQQPDHATQISQAMQTSQGAPANKWADMISAGDPQTKQALIQYIADHPDDIDLNNAFQRNMVGAQFLKQQASMPQQQSLEMPDIFQIHGQDLANIAHGGASNFLGIQQDAAKDVAKLNLEQAQEARYQAMATNGGMGGAGVVAANKIKSEWDSTHPDKPMSWTDAYMMATAKQGQGITIDPVTGQTIVAAGAADSAKTMAGAKESGTQGAIVAAAGPKATAEARGTALGTATVDLAKLQAGMPQLQNTVNDLINLSEAATYTAGGEAYNAIIRQSGLTVPSGATAKSEYDARIKNVLLPQLKSMFGARVTNFDIQTATDLLGNPNLSPPEKKAQLNAFIQQKYAQVQSDQSLVKSLGGEAQPSVPSANQSSGWAVRKK